MDERKVISIEDLKKLAQGELVDLPSFVSGDEVPFTVRLRRPSLIQMVKAGKIPNELLVEANALFTKGAGGVVTKNASDTEALSKMCVLLEVICEASFVEPTYKEIKEAGIELTDSQLLAVFEYTQNGVANLKSFH